MQTIVLTFGIALALATPGLACDLDASSPVDRPIEVAADGSFENAGSGGWHVIFGSAPHDHGGGIVEQVITDGYACPPTGQYLLVADCDTANLVRIDGVYSRTERAELQAQRREAEAQGHVIIIPAAFGMGGRLAANLRPPEGPIVVSAASTIAELENAAATAGFRATTDVVAQIALMEPRNRFDPFVGCRIHYPDSHGAEMSARMLEG